MGERSVTTIAPALRFPPEPPACGEGRGGGRNGDVQGMIIGSADIWLRERFHSYRSNAAAGEISCATAEMSRRDANGPATTFELE